MKSQDDRFHTGRKPLCLVPRSTNFSDGAHELPTANSPKLRAAIIPDHASLGHAPAMVGSLERRYRPKIESFGFSAVCSQRCRRDNLLTLNDRRREQSPDCRGRSVTMLCIASSDENPFWHRHPCTHWPRRESGGAARGDRLVRPGFKYEDTPPTAALVASARVGCRRFR
jgi:hypothetical protein